MTRLNKKGEGEESRSPAIREKGRNEFHLKKKEKKKSPQKLGEEGRRMRNARLWKKGKQILCSESDSS